MKETEQTDQPNRVKMMKEFFECKNKELLDFKRDDPGGFEQVAEGLVNGTYTY